MTETETSLLDAATTAAGLWDGLPASAAGAASAAAIGAAAVARDAERVGASGSLDHLPARRRVELRAHALRLADWIAGRWPAGTPVVIGVNGGQGSGKSTLSALTVEALARRDRRALVLGIDDLYLPAAARAELARTVHPLLATRGVPGTHDVALGVAVLDACRAGGSASIALPRFDKARDDRLDEAGWPRATGPVDVVLFEGWCVGATAQDEAALAVPVNRLEADEDPAGAWRRHANDRLARDYPALFGALDGLVMLRVPDFGAVRRWREAQEAELRATRGAGMTPAAVQRFVDHYERLTRHMLATLPARADLVLDLAEDHGIAAVSPGDPAIPAAGR